MSVKFSQKQEQIVITIYHSCQNLNETARKCGFLSNVSVKNILKRNKIDAVSLVPSYTKNYNFFNKIDTEEKAYFLGLMFADGNNYINKDGDYQISIVLQEQDKSILEKFRNLIIPTKQLYFINRKNKNWSNCYRLKFDDKIISNQLNNLGCVSNKSLVLQFPALSNLDLQRHFIRGYYDGDGSISKWVKNGNPLLMIIMYGV